MNAATKTFGVTHPLQFGHYEEKQTLKPKMSPLAPPSMTATNTTPLTRRLMRCWRHFRTPVSAWLLAIAGMVTVSITEPLVPALLKPLLDKGFVGGELNPWLIPVALVGLFLLRGMGSFAAQIALAKVASIGVLKLRMQLFSKLQSAHPSLFRNESASAIGNTMIHEVQVGASVMVSALMTLGRDSLTLLTLLAYLLYLNWQLILIVTLLFPMLFLTIRTATRRLGRINREMLGAVDELAYTLEENVLAHHEIRLQGAQHQQSSKFKHQAENLMRLVMKSMTSSALITPMTQLLSAIALSCVISFALLQSSLQGTSVGSFAAFVTGMLMLIAPIKHLSEVAGPLTRGLASLERAFDFLDQYEDESGGVYKTARVQGNISFEKVCVRYPKSDTNVVADLDLVVRAGETVALVGSSGSGKTTLVNLLPRWVDSTEGKICIDGIPLHEFDLLSLRQQIAMVSQHVVILNDTIFHNVCLGQAQDRDRAQSCLESANLGDWLSHQALGLDTRVGHNASQLSGGQRQRLAIARAMYKNAPILILDEATSALDNESERLIQDALLRLSQGRTTLVIAHRLSTIVHADRIVVMERGRIVETGRHSELMERKGTYWNYVQMGERSDLGA